MMPLAMPLPRMPRHIIYILPQRVAAMRWLADVFPPYCQRAVIQPLFQRAPARDVARVEEENSIYRRGRRHIYTKREGEGVQSTTQQIYA